MSDKKKSRNSQEKKKGGWGLIVKLLVAIASGILVGQLSFLPEVILQIPITFSAIFGEILTFFIPLMIVGFIVKGIADLSDGAGMLLGITTGLAYLSTMVGGFLAYIVGTNLFPLIINSGAAAEEGIEELEPLFEFPIEPMFTVSAAIVFAFMFGIAISWLRHKKGSKAMYNIFNELNAAVTFILEGFIIPLLPYFIFGNFINLSYTGEIFSMLLVFAGVFVTIIVLHWVLIIGWFIIAGLYTGKSPWMMVKNQISAYVAALGLMSSAASIPFNLESARKNGVSERIREFVIPFCSTAHLMGSVSTIVSSLIAVLILNDMPVNIGLIAPFIVVLGVALVAAPGAPGGAIMSALPFLGLVGVDPTGTIANLLISFYITQDGFGTAANITGDNALAVIIDKIYIERYAADDVEVKPVETD